MNCDQAEELLGAYAVDALPHDEAAAFRAHLESCADHAAKGAVLRTTAGALAATVDDISPPPGLRRKIADAVAATAGVTREPAVSIPIGIRQRTADGTPAHGRFARLTAPAWGAIAAALAIAVAGLIAWNIALTSDAGRSARVESVSTLEQSTGAQVGFVIVFDDGTATVVGEALPRLDPSQAYQMWSLDEDGAATSLGLMQFDDRGVANATATLRGDATQRIALTVEPASGSDQPTAAPLYIAEL
jgi:anti-sigma-K factor RskA